MSDKGKGKEKANPQCSTCLFDITRSNRRIRCNFCMYESCTLCTERYILSRIEDARCMSETCKKGWDRKFLKDNFSDKFINGPYKKHREATMLEHQTVRLGATLPYAEATRRLKKIKTLHDAVHKTMDAFRPRKLGMKITNREAKRQIFRDLHYASHMLYSIRAAESLFLAGKSASPLGSTYLGYCMQRYSDAQQDYVLYDESFFRDLIESTSKTLTYFGDGNNFSRESVFEKKVDSENEKKPKVENYASRGKCEYKDCEQGLIGKSWICVSCERKTCRRCLVPIQLEKNILKKETGGPELGEKNNENVTILEVKTGHYGDDKKTTTTYIHTCDNNHVENIKSIRQCSKACPNCRVRVEKTYGCDQMWCIYCNTSFSWNTGKPISVKFFHNPHYTEYLRTQRAENLGTGHDHTNTGGGSIIGRVRNRRNPTSVYEGYLFDDNGERITFCGRQVTHILITAANSYYGLASDFETTEILKNIEVKLNVINEFRENIQTKATFLMESRRERLPEYGRPVLATDYLTNKLHEEWETLRIEYLLKEIDKNKFAKSLQICEKRYKKAVDILQVKTTNLSIVLDHIAQLVNGQSSVKECSLNIQRTEKMSLEAIAQIGRWYGHKNSPCTESLYKYLSISRTKPQSRKRKANS